MTGLVDWAAERARMVIAFIVLSLVVGGFAYGNLPKEGEPDIEIPALFVTVPFPGISAEDSETLLVKPMETELADLDGLKTMTSTAAEGFGGVGLEFEFGWDKTKVMADVRDAMNNAQANFPEGADQYTINEINFSEFPIIIVNLSGPVPERTMIRVAKDLQDRLESLDSVLEAGIAGSRDEMLEVTIDPLRLESYNVTAGELINVVRNNNQLIAAGNLQNENGAFSVKIPSSFDEARDVYDLPVKTNGDRVVTLGDLAEINLTFEDRQGTARFNGVNSIALQVVKRKGFNLIDTVTLIKSEVEAARQGWPAELQSAVTVDNSNDQSREVQSMVRQLEGSVLTAVALVMIVILASLGTRAALLVGFAIPTSFLLCFAFLAVMGVSVSNIVMFGLILAVGMLVDGAIVVVEYADKRIKEGAGPMTAYVEAAKRMFWPVVSSTATTLCAFLPMLFWPGVPGQFMGMLPVTLIFVLSASLVVALVYLPVMGGVSGRISRAMAGVSDGLRARTPWLVRAALVPVALMVLFVASMQVLNSDFLIPMGGALAWAGSLPSLIGVPLQTLIVGLPFCLAAMFASIILSSARIIRPPKRVDASYRRSPFGWVIHMIVGNPVMPILSIGAIVGFVGAVFVYFGENNNGVEFFVDSEPEQAIVYVRARGNLSLEEKDALVRRAEAIVMAHPGVKSTFATSGDGGLNNNTGGAEGPADAIGQIQLETIAWEDRMNRPDLDGNVIIAELTDQLKGLPGVKTEILELAGGPASGKPLHLRLTGDNLQDLAAATAMARTKFETTPGLVLIEDTLPLPGIDWQINVDVEKAGRYGADVATVGAMVQLVTRGILLDTMRVDTSDEEIEIRVRLPEEYRVLSTLDTLKVRTAQGLVPLANFVTREPVAKLAEISRVDQQRHFDVKADVATGLVKFTGEDGSIVGFGSLEQANGQVPFDWNGTTYFVTSGIDDALRTQADADTLGMAPVNGNERIEHLSATWLETAPFPAGIDWEWTGDQEEQAESMAFLGSAFLAALGLMFIILLAQFNSFYNAFLVLLAVVLSTTGVLIGMLVMGQYFSVIMTGTGIVALAGIVVNNNIVLIDTYQEYSRYMPRVEAIVRTAETRIRPVLLTTITTMAGLAPMMFGLSLDFFAGGYSIDSPTALWWKNLATAVVFGLGVATVLTLIFTPAMLALRIWIVTYALWIARALAALSFGRGSRAARDWAVTRAARRVKHPELIWDDLVQPEPVPQTIRRQAPLRAAE